jgi:pyruvate kinase
MMMRSMLSLSRSVRPSVVCGGRTARLISTTFDLPDPGDSTSNLSQQLQLTKIVATIGPTSEQLGPLKEVTAAGMRIMRLNFSHATKEEVELRTANFQIVQKELSPPGSQHLQEVRSILLDTKGPEIRTGKLANDASGHETVTLQAGSKITLHTDETVRDAGSSETDLYIDYAGLGKCLKPGMKVLLDDGAIILKVESIDSGTVSCIIENTGDLRSRAGVNLPLADTSDLPAMSDKDRVDIKYGMTMGIDFVAASFVQTAEGVREIRSHIKECARELGWDPTEPLPLIISKIETAGALNHFDAILEESDGIMVARGDLGVEIPLQQVTNAQKEMIAACNAVGKPVIVATQMLESMTKSPRPTRAEVSDVTNAVYDGADAVMLSGETAKGKYPTETVKFMNEIILSAERYASSGALGCPTAHMTKYLLSPKSADSAIAKAAVTSSHERQCKAILVLSNHGTLPPLVAAFRPNVPILAFCPSAKIARQLQIHRGIHPIVGLAGVSQAKRAAHAVDEAKHSGIVQSGDEVVIVSMEDEDVIGHNATMKIVTVP